MDFRCPLGHFCAAGLVNLEDGRCPQGTFSNHTGLANVSQCLECPPGMFCGDIGLARPSGPCHAGYYCVAGAADAIGARCDAREAPPYTLNPATFTLHPEPCTLHPAPYTLHPTPYTPHLQPSTLNPNANP